MKGILRGLTEHGAATDPASPDARLLGRTYAIPFDAVWSAAMRLAGKELRRWTLESSDDIEGLIEARSKTLLFGQQDDVRIEISLDENAQTRVDMSSRSRLQRPDLGRNRRAIGRFLDRLDKSLGARPEQILDATRAVAWTDRR